MNGSLQKKGNIWYAVIPLEGKKQKWISTKQKSKPEANKVLRNILYKMENNLYIDPTKIYFLDFIRDWLDNVSKNQIEETTYQGYSLIFDVHIKPYYEREFKGLKLHELKTIHLQKYFDYKHKKQDGDTKTGLSGNTLRRHKILFKSSLDYAVRMRLINANPIKDVTMPKKEKFVGSFYNAEQIEQLLQIVKNTPIEAPVFITVYYGLRRGEILGLRWQDINFSDNTITINNTRVRYNKKDIEKSPKTEKSRRTLPLIDSVGVYLKKLHKKYKENKLLMGKDFEDNGRVCCWEDGSLYGISYVGEKLNKLLKDNDMTHIRFHDLRHSCASFLLKQGFSLKEIQEWLGHSNISTTADIYAHIDFEMKKNIAAKINNKFAI